jgi:phosphatidylserine decarboxylase
MADKRHKQLLERTFGGRTAVGMSHLLADVSVPAPVLRPIIRMYTAGMGVNTSEYEVPEDGFHRFNEFFGRRLRPGVRPISDAADAVVSPCDGRLTAFDHLNGDIPPVFHIKGFAYSLPGLLGMDDDGEVFRDGGYLIIYLHPRDYHRVHVPVDASLTSVVHIPGSRFPVTGWCESRVDGIYEKNERMVFNFDLPEGTSLSLAMVAAFGVGNIDTPFGPGFGHGQNARRQRIFESPRAVRAGEDLGAFLVGSTVVLVWSKDALVLDRTLAEGPVEMGRKIGTAGTADGARP